MNENAVAQLRVAWLAVALVVVLGFAAVVLPAQRRIAAIEAHAGDLADLADRNEAVLARLESLERTRTRVRRDLARLAGKAGSGKATVAALHVLEGEAGRNHLIISGIAPANDDVAAAHREGEEDVAVSLRGRYRDVMNAVADLSRHDALVEVRAVSLARVDIRTLFPNVDATVSVALFHTVKDLVKEEAHAQAATH
ncbi:MAG TPA: hypothetical protein VK760_04660 [Candidatus Acidoferrales bacterium]|nr:hypothetical protein [Candidatus Acidoferrales bacterium]